MSIEGVMAVAALVVFLLSFALTGLVKLYAQRRLLDIPNDRSSHLQPTPRGGGLAILLALAAGLLGFHQEIGLDQGLGLSMLALVPLVLMGFVDDHRGLSARSRFGVQVLAALWVFWALGYPVPKEVSSSGFVSVAIALPFALLLLTWFLNLYNFMDGIDGLAGSQLVFVFFAAALVHESQVGLSMFSGESQVAVLAGSATLGFLIWNWPPARIFMGDVGSGPLGFLIGVLLLSSTARGELSLEVWVILNGVFLIDATLTLLVRLGRGDAWYQAHRTHAYQRASRRFESHRTVTLGLSLINLSWLLPIALLAHHDPAHGGIYLSLALGPLIALALHYRAGQPE